MDGCALLPEVYRSAAHVTDAVLLPGQNDLDGTGIGRPTKTSYASIMSSRRK